ncbi:MAG TPA: hypothetical protein VF647_13815 [Longimicrobium sp.]|jgi:hypothetical protein
MTKREPTPLTASPSRQAIPTLKGYAGQILRTVREWVELKPGERLYLEGAEDFDRIGDTSAETVQVKEVSGSITLRTKEVREAIVHLWQHQKNNPDRKIQLRFLTTAKRGREKGAHFGSSEKGFDYWDRCREAGVTLEPLRQFLAIVIGAMVIPTPRRESRGARESREVWNGTVNELQDFITRADDEDLRERLIRRIHWETASEEQAEVREEIRRALLAYGERVHDAQPAECDKVLPHLSVHAWKVVCRKKKRWLDRPAFQRIFQKVVAVPIPRRTYNRLRKAAKAGSQQNPAPAPPRPTEPFPTYQLAFLLARYLRADPDARQRMASFGSPTVYGITEFDWWFQLVEHSDAAGTRARLVEAAVRALPPAVRPLIAGELERDHGWPSCSVLGNQWLSRDAVQELVERLVDQADDPVFHQPGATEAAVEAFTCWALRRTWSRSPHSPTVIEARLDNLGKSSPYLADLLKMTRTAQWWAGETAWGEAHLGTALGALALVRFCRGDPEFADAVLEDLAWYAESIEPINEDILGLVLQWWPEGHERVRDLVDRYVEAKLEDLGPADRWERLSELRTLESLLSPPILSAAGSFGGVGREDERFMPSVRWAVRAAFDGQVAGFLESLGGIRPEVYLALLPEMSSAPARRALLRAARRAVLAGLGQVPGGSHPTSAALRASLRFAEPAELEGMAADPDAYSLFLDCLWPPLTPAHREMINGRSWPTSAAGHVAQLLASAAAADPTKYPPPA